MLGIAGSTTRLPYEALTVKYVVDGLELITDGKGVVKNTNGNYNLIIYDGNISLSDLLGDSLLNDLDWSAYNHNLNRTTYFDSYTNMSGYIYALARYYNQDNIDRIEISQQSPSFYVKTLFDLIFSQKGWTITNEIDLEQGYINEVTTTAIGYDRSLVGSNIPIDFSELFGDVKQIDFIKAIMQQYGLIFRKVRNENKLEFIKLSSLINDEYGHIDWSDKYSTFEDESYNPNYAQVNNFKFKYEDNDSNTEQVFADGEILVNNVNVDKSKDLLTSIFKASDRQITYPGVGLAHLVEHWDGEVTDITPRLDGLRYFKIDKVSIFRTYDFIGDALGNVGVSGVKPYVLYEDMTYQDKLDENYSKFSDILQDYKMLKLSLNLSVLDIYALDFFKLYYFNQLGSFYYLNKVNSFKKNKVTSVDFVRVTPFIPSTDVELSTLTLISATTTGDSAVHVCDNISIADLYHNGAGSQPVVTDLIYQDIGGGKGGLFNGADLFYKLITPNDYMQIDANGVVLAVYNCGEIPLTELTGFTIGTTSSGTSALACSTVPGGTITRYHDGGFSDPNLNDYIYEDIGGGVATLYDGSSNWWKITAESIQINNVGLVTGIFTCP